MDCHLTAKSQFPDVMCAEDEDLFGASSAGVAKKKRAIPVKSVQARQLFDESESMREWVLRVVWEDICLEEEEK